jgi:uncharacterized membrane protein YhaH (DUF805 family)
MGQIEFIQGEITQNRFLMGVFIAIIISLFSYIVSNFKNEDIYLLIGSGIGLIILMSGVIYLQIKIKKQIRSLKDI